MRQIDNKMETPISATTNCLTALSIVIDDFDSAKVVAKDQTQCINEEQLQSTNTETNHGNSGNQKAYTRQASDASIKKILDEVEQRKTEFLKLLDEHSQVIENLKRIEQLENGHQMSQVKS